MEGGGCAKLMDCELREFGWRFRRRQRRRSPPSQGISAVTAPGLGAVNRRGPRRLAEIVRQRHYYRDDNELV